MKVVIKIGGSLFMNDNGPNSKYLTKLIPVLKKIDKNNKLTIVTGGGKPVRSYLKEITPLKLTNSQKEKAIIQIVHANTILFSEMLDKKPVFDIKPIKNGCVLGAITPGRSTDTNAAIAAKKTKADILIKLTNVNGIYDKDPNKYKNATKFDHISFSDAKKIERKTTPGNYGVFDPTALKIVSNNRIKTIIANGRRPKILLDILKGKKIGTEISS